MSNPTITLPDAAAAVAGLGGCQGDIDALDEAGIEAAMAALRALDDAAQPFRVWLAAAIAKRSDHTLGYEGLARKNGFPTPATYIQSLTGSTKEEATKLARLGEMVVEAELSGPAIIDSATGEITGGSGASVLAVAATSGEIGVDLVEAIRRGLGRPDAAVTAEQLRVEAERLLERARTATRTGIGSLTPEALQKFARQARETLDSAAIEAGEKERFDQRYTRTWEKDGMVGGSWRLPADDGGALLHTTLKLALANVTGGPRFPHTDANGEPVEPTASDAAIEDTRTPEQIVADAFVQIVRNGIGADPTVVPGASRAPVQVIVTEKVLSDVRATNGQSEGYALLEHNLSPITLGKLGEYLCEGGTVAIQLNDDGTIDVGREQRLFTRKQRRALAVRDGGCRFPGCPCPPSWTEAHHILHWKRDDGPTDIINGILLCRYHHMLIHTNGWEIIREDGPFGGTFWLKPPPEKDPDQTLIPMPTKNPLFATAPPGSTTAA